ncbi:DUF324 domain containing Cmr2-like protein [Methanosarcina barkeri str. Wiesmoor]|uniref:DUF324 domain containing Cmr2-like protein n=2 Tax=Methanosarcina barkeri TaxID=2208 RepID=A0A0E3QPZ9_METBA|nr:RAMP superfamily CRISPR-associated protein [Methanosarcina barkeri]AKB52625.1 DUF324 domain containing Cmr2-like protein [Methanosarcina barkeri str. Wiesmoor]
MNIDWGSVLYQQEKASINDLKIIVEEIDKAGKENKEELEKKLEIKLKGLILPNEYLAYHYMATINQKLSDNFREVWQKQNLKVNLEEVIEKWELTKYIKDNFICPEVNISTLPSYSFILNFMFKLKKPYISLDENDFHIIDNPLRKDKVLHLPFVSPSSWKGSLRNSLWQLNYDYENDKIRRIFGNERSPISEDIALRMGRLCFFPTFFTKKSLEIINPHDRKRRVGTVPILMESVPQDTTGFFTLLYVPFDLIGCDEKEIRKQVSEDIQLVSEGLKSMFTYYGFGAKTSSGYGTTYENITDGTITLRNKSVKVSVQEEKFEFPKDSYKKFLDENGILKDEFRGKNGGPLSNSELGNFNGSQKEFKKFKTWYNDNIEKWQKYLKSQNTPTSEWPTWRFEGFSELIDVSKNIATSLESSGVHNES